MLCWLQEEQQGGASANYDVELLHAAAAHEDMFISGNNFHLIFTCVCTCTCKVNVVLCKAPIHMYDISTARLVSFYNYTVMYRMVPMLLIHLTSVLYRTEWASNRCLLQLQPSSAAPRVFSWFRDTQRHQCS